MLTLKQLLDEALEKAAVAQLEQQIADGIASRELLKKIEAMPPGDIKITYEKAPEKP